jgi:hypothetical protein
MRARRVANTGSDQHREKGLVAHLAADHFRLVANGAGRAVDRLLCPAGGVGQRRSNPVLHQGLDLRPQPGDLRVCVFRISHAIGSSVAGMNGSWC